nr:phosphatidylglycerophosphatase A [uncultured Helicobacter sp.]
MARNVLRILFLSVLYSGKCPKAPGTIGSLVSVFLGLPLLYYSVHTLFLLACLLGVIAIREIDIFEKSSQTHDEKWVVIDELVGVWIAMAIAGLSIIGVIGAFVFFRIFDIWKPSVIGRIDRQVKGGLGVVLDDVLAGFLGGIATLLLLKIFAYFDLSPNLWIL